MDYFIAGIKAFIYVVIFSLVKIIVPKLLGEIKPDKGKNGKRYFDKKSISNVFLGGAIFFTVLFSFLINVPSNVEGEAKIYLSIGLVIFCLFWYVLSLIFSLWFLCLDTDIIIYRNYLGKKVTLNTNDINYYERKPDGKLCLYSNSKLAATFEPEYAEPLLSWLGKNNIKNNNKTNKFFTIRPAKYQRVLSICCLVGFLSFFIMGIVVQHVMGTIAFGCLVIFGIWNCVNHYSEKYVVGEGHIEVSSLFKKSTLIPYSELNKAEIKQGDNVSYLLLYSKNRTKPLLKINTYYENAFLLKEIAVKKKWIQ